MNLFKRWYGLYKLHRACKYVARELTIVRWAAVIVSRHPVYYQTVCSYEQGYLHAGGELMKAKQRVRDAR